VVSGPVSFICDPVAGTLSRVSGYAIASTQPKPPTGGTTALLAQNITACTMTYGVTNQRTGLVSIWLTMKSAAGGALVNLFQQVQVSNVP